MKKSNLFLAAPLMLVPSLATLPIVASCNKQKSADVVIDALFAANVDVTPISEQLITGDDYSLVLSIKEDKLGTEFLPNTLTSVKSGNVELWQLKEENNANGTLDYYIYEPYDNNTKAYLYVRTVSGPINISARTAQVDHISATGVDETGSLIAEFEVGETLTNNTSRVAVTATLTNGEDVLLNDYYTIKVGIWSEGHVFATEDVGSEGKGTVTYYGKTTSFNYKVNAKTIAWMTYEGLYSTETTKYSSFLGDKGVIETFNKAQDAGDYTIMISPGTYKFEATDTLDITEGQGKNLVLRAAQSPYFDTETMKVEYSVTFQHDYNAADQYLIGINNGNDSTTGSVTIKGILFDTPTPKVTLIYPTYNNILLSCDNTHAPHDVFIDRCKFVGNSDETQVAVNAVASNGANVTYLPTNLIIGGCIGQYLNTLYDGQIKGTSSSEYDLTIYGSVSYNAQKLLNVDSVDANILISNIVANVMYKANEEATSDLTDGMTLRGTVGTKGLNVTKTIFNQMRKRTQSTSLSGFINFADHDSRFIPTGTLRNINLSSIEFNNLETDTELHDIYNSIGTDDQDWNITFYDEESVTVKAVVTSGTLTGEEKHHWDIPQY